MHHCAICGEPVADHGREPLGPLQRAEILKGASHSAYGASRVWAMERTCPVVWTGKVWRSERLAGVLGDGWQEEIGGTE